MCPSVQHSLGSVSETWKAEMPWLCSMAEEMTMQSHPFSSCSYHGGRGGYLATKGLGPIILAHILHCRCLMELHSPFTTHGTRQQQWGLQDLLPVLLRITLSLPGLTKHSIIRTSSEPPECGSTSREPPVCLKTN